MANVIKVHTSRIFGEKRATFRLHLDDRTLLLSAPKILWTTRSSCFGRAAIATRFA